MTTIREREFTVVMRGSSAVIFRPKENLFAKEFPSTKGPVNICYTTRWLRKDENITVPGHLWIEIKGKETKLEDILVPYANAGLALLPLLSLSANAAIGEPNIELGFDSSQDANERDYFQQYVPPESGVAHFARQIQVKETLSILDALNRSVDAERIHRAANQYRMALDSWGLGREGLSLAHLWMALEALTKVRIRLECRRRSISTEQELANSLGIELNQLDPTIRRDLILKGDDECYSKSKDASNGFEHGFLGYDKIRDLARDTRHRMAQYIRTEIFEQLGLDEDTYKILTNDPFDKPMGNWPLVKYIRGKLLGNNQEIAATGNAYPFLKWNPIINKCEVDGDGKVIIQFSENFTQELGERITFQPVSYETWKPE